MFEKLTIVLRTPSFSSSSQFALRRLRSCRGKRRIFFSINVTSVLVCSTVVWSVIRRAVSSSCRRRRRSRASGGVGRGAPKKKRCSGLLDDMNKRFPSDVWRCIRAARPSISEVRIFDSSSCSKWNLRAFLRFSHDLTFHVWGRGNVANLLSPNPMSTACGQVGLLTESTGACVL